MLFLSNSVHLHSLLDSALSSFVLTGHWQFLLIWWRWPKERL